MASVRINGQQQPLDTVNRDGYALACQGLASLIRLAQGNDAKVALVAAQALVAYGEQLMAQKAARQPEPVKAFQQSRSEILESLKGLYSKALGTPPLVVEAESAESIPVVNERS